MSYLSLFVDFGYNKNGDLLTYNPYNDMYWDDIFELPIHYYTKDMGYFYSPGKFDMSFYGRIFKNSAGEVDTDSIVTRVEINKEGQQRDVTISGFKTTLKELMETDSFYDLMSSKDTLFVGGGYGNQVVHGTGNADDMQMGHGTDKARGLGGDDNIYGYYGDDKLWGGSGSDRVSGDRDNDQIIGGQGGDTLYGGPGEDQFIYDRLGYSKARSGGFDTIDDFQTGRDKIDLSNIDANTNRSGDQKFTFVEKAGTNFHGKAGELIWGLASDHNRNELALALDVNGDKEADFYLQLHSKTAISADDFIL
jgi:Ca2+-binding RTX toxin-like protein